MKTERRHELQQNVLADWLGNQAEALKPYSKAIIGGFLLTLALLFALTAMRGNQRQRESRSWNEYFVAATEADIDGLRDMAGRYRGTEAAAWALQSAGDIGLATGSQAMFNDRADANEFLTGARDDYSSALNLAKTEMLKQRALMGLAQAHEALNEFSEAESQYGRVMQQWPESSLAETAKERVAFLKQPSTKEFYDWFYQQKPVPRNPNPLGGSPPIQTPSVYGDLPSDPSLKLPDESELGGSPLSAPESGIESAPSEERASEFPTDPADSSEGGATESGGDDSAIEPEAGDAPPTP